MENPIGYMVPSGNGFKVRCPICEAGAVMAPKGNHGTPIHQVNIYPYNQTCCNCNSVLVVGQSSAWPELFDGR